ncbi:uncharacterized protein LAESUDRAFT_765154 [Laetiporus sulphureus 93-53]|uniref:Uncharacterized protein n=1 Tax=Laetiporus sulphureus 93-53 TaxID=1314785 RepID=A0A165AXK6_9APHY|nr:uncharacterized protein LAESUDRAFT_765154 [Laetiporus sulphureus 93-53]KZS99849.1 hypothetical protein LAESUDRAFT_765154 [Laetiporus sulphureus 93-53]
MSPPTSRSLVRANPAFFIPRTAFLTPYTMSRSRRPALSAAHALTRSARLTSARTHARDGDTAAATLQEEGR